MPVPATPVALASGARLVCRPLVTTDAEAVTDLMAICEEAAVGERMIELADIVGDWQRPSFDLHEQSVGMFDGEQLVAYGEVHQHRAEVYVRPDARGQGLGTELLRWTWEVARAAGVELVGQSVPVQLTDAVALFRAYGYTRLWTSWILELAAGQPVASVELPPDVTVRQRQSEADDHAAYRVVEDAFNEWPNRDPQTFEDWAAFTVLRPGFESWQLLLALDISEQVIGVCLLSPTDDAIWVNELAVRADHRGEGLGRALLVQAFAVAQARGLPTVQLNTDSRTGALGLYEHVGMHVTQTFEHWSKQLD